MSSLSRSLGIGRVIHRVHAKPSAIMTRHVLRRPLSSLEPMKFARRTGAIRAFDPHIWSLRTASQAATTVNLDEEGLKANEDKISVLLNRLNNAVRRTGRVQAFFVNEVIDLVKQSGTCTPNHALMLIRCWGSLMVDEEPAFRTEKVQELWSMLRKINVELDSSHYNALLRVYVDNEHSFSPTEFLSEMEQQVEPNRVTYQQLIAQYCQSGDISGATVILEHMKKNDMPVNEHVFHSLIVGHCRSGDTEAARGIVDIMEKSAIPVGVVTHITLIRELARAGQGGDVVLAELERLASEEVELSDKDYLEVAVQLVKVKDPETAAKVVDMMPKKRGYFQEIRNAIPDLVRSGETEIPCQLVMNFQAPPQVGSVHVDPTSNMSDKGIFFLDALVRTDCPPEAVVKYIDKIAEGNNANFLATRLLEIYVDNGKSAQGKKFRDFFVEKISGEFTKAAVHTPWLRKKGKEVKTKEDVCQLTEAMEEVGIRPLASAVADSLMPVLLKDEPLVSEAIKDVNGLLTWSFKANAALLYLFNRENNEDFERAARFAMVTRASMKAYLWNASLARSYLATGNLDAFVALVALSYAPTTRAEKVDPRADVDIATSLLHLHSLAPKYKGAGSADDVLVAVMDALAEHHIGIPPMVAQQLREASESEALAEASQKLEALYADGPTYWTPANVDAFWDKIRPRIFNGPNPNRSRSKSFYLNLEKSDVDRVMADLKAKREANPDIVVTGMVKHQVVSRLVKDGRVDEAMAFLKSFPPADENNQVYMQSHLAIAHRLILDDRFDAARDCLTSANLEATQSKIGISEEVSKFMEDIAKEKSEAMTKAACDLMEEVGLLTGPTRRFSSFSVLVKVNQGDLEGAVEEFERHAKDNKALYYRQQLTNALVNRGDMVLLQRVLDASIALIGEEASLYDLATSFLACGKSAQAKKLFETPGLRYNHRRVVNILDWMERQRMHEAFEDLIGLMEPVFSCDREYMYSRLISLHSHDPKKVRDIWVKMQEEGFIPSDGLKTTLADIIDGTPRAEKAPEPARSGKAKPAPKPSRSTNAEPPKSVEQKVADLKRVLEDRNVEGAHQLNDKIRSFFDRSNLRLNDLKPFAKDILKVCADRPGFGDFMALKDKHRFFFRVLDMVDDRDFLDVFDQVSDLELKKVTNARRFNIAAASYDDLSSYLRGLTTDELPWIKPQMNAVDRLVQQPDVGPQRLVDLAAEIDSNWFSSVVFCSLALNNEEQAVASLLEKLGEEKASDLRIPRTMNLPEPRLAHLKALIPSSNETAQVKVLNLLLLQSLRAGTLPQDVFEDLSKRGSDLEHVMDSSLKLIKSMSNVDQAIRDQAEKALERRQT